MGCTYVKDFDFGSPKVQVKAYARGGPVKKAAAAPVRKSVPVGPVGPLLALKKGGKTSCGCA